MTQMKQEDKITAGDLSKTKKKNLPARGFKTMIIKILTGLEKKVEDLSKTFNKKIKGSNQR